MDNGYCIYLEQLATARLVITGDGSYNVVSGDRRDEHLPTSEQAARDFFLESLWAQGEHIKNHTWTTWLGGPDFGLTARPDPSNQMYYCRLWPVEESLIERGLAVRPQPEDLEREVRKFNISLNPNINMPRTMAWKIDDDRKEPTPEEEVALRLAHFPNVPGLVTKAPMVLSGNSFKMATNTEHCTFEKVMAVAELREKILEHHLGQWQSLSNLARTSQTMFKYIESIFAHWDLTNQWFGGCDLTLDVYEARKYRGAWSKDQKTQAKRILQATHTEDKQKKLQKERLLNSTKYVSVHPSRERHRQDFGKKTLSGEKVGNTEWYDHSDSYPDPMNEDPVFKGESHISLLRSVYRHGTKIQYLHLHRVPYLNVSAVKALVPSMPNLRVLGIYSCDLLNFSHTKELMNIVIDTNKMNSARPPIDFDYYPRFHRGPVENRVGSYGVFWNDVGGIKTPLAVAAGLLSIMRVAKDGNINLASSRDKAFHKWLNDFPWEFCTLPSILASIARILYFEGQYDRMLKAAYRERYGNNWKALVSSQEVDKAFLEKTLHMDLYIAVLGKPQKQEKMDKMDMFTCATCEEKLLAGFFKEDQAQRAPDNRKCHGCDLQSVLQAPTHNFGTLRRTIAAVPWYCRNRTTVDNLRDLFRKGSAHARIWQPRVMQVCEALRDDEPQRVKAKLLEWEEHRDDLIEEKSTFTRQYQHRAQDKAMGTAQDSINECKTVLGEQVLPATKTAEANNWDEMRRLYCVRLALESGRLGNLGPHMGLGWEKWM
ncbi:hypothetical protein PG985_012379 [Apiospora marii]|uniref:Uncharacterized protein n=1 Tax=Apiospora marii TaxID=335849 RepID=A0ABR1REG7_9PEZI